MQNFYLMPSCLGSGLFLTASAGLIIFHLSKTCSFCKQNHSFEIVLHFFFFFCLCWPQNQLQFAALGSALGQKLTPGIVPRLQFFYRLVNAFLWTDKNSHSGLTNAPPVLMKQSENLSESVVKQMTAQSLRLPPRGGGVGFDWI